MFIVKCNKVTWFAVDLIVIHLIYPDPQMEENGEIVLCICVSLEFEYI